MTARPFGSDGRRPATRITRSAGATPGEPVVERGIAATSSILARLSEDFTGGIEKFGEMS
jgi:hypothetical protein